MNEKTCHILEPPPSEGGMAKWDIWPQTDDSIQ
jgi:hypothetical protein